MSDQVSIQELLDGLEEVATSSSQPLVLSQRDIDVSTIEGMRTVINYHEDRVQGLIQEGYEVMAVLVVRDDKINYGASGTSAVEHVLMTVMVKIKK